MADGQPVEATNPLSVTRGETERYWYGLVNYGPGKKCALTAIPKTRRDPEADPELDPNPFTVTTGVVCNFWYGLVAVKDGVCKCALVSKAPPDAAAGDTD